jgi:glucosamine--fructose-6-phosphate aminotransferase (isomerizing)
MLREIREQPAVVAGLLGVAPRESADLIRDLRRRPPVGVVIAARGTSDNAAVYGKYLIETTLGVPVSLAAPSIATLYRRSMRVRNHLVMGLSQSGESTDIVEFIESCRRAGAITLGITNDTGSALARAVDHALALHAGRERSVAATKTYVAQLGLLAILAEAWSGDRALSRRLEHLPRLIARALQTEGIVRAGALRYRYMRECMVTGRGFNYATAREAALKLEETCSVVAEALSAADLQHGPIAAVERDFPVLLFAFSGRTMAHLRALAFRLRRRGAELMIVTNNRSALACATVSVYLSFAVDEILSPIPAIVPGQLFAYYLSVARGLNPDRPRGLRKITQTR